MESNIVQQLEEIAEEMCDNYCKWPAKYLEENEHEVAYEKMWDEICVNCPLDKLH